MVDMLTTTITKGLPMLKISVVCWSLDERSVLIEVNGKRSWFRVEFVGSNPDETMNDGYVTIQGQRICVFS